METVLSDLQKNGVKVNLNGRFAPVPLNLQPPMRPSGGRFIAHPGRSDGEYLLWPQLYAKALLVFS
jgi:hypothetical protein